MELIERLRQLFPSLSGIRLAYLFGSQVSGNTGPMSDIDLGVLLTELDVNDPGNVALAHQIRAGLGAGKVVEIVSLNTASIELAYAIIAQGVCVYEVDIATRVDYEARVLGMYGDYLPVLRAQRREILQGGDDERRIQRYREAFERTERTLSQIRSVHK